MVCVFGALFTGQFGRLIKYHCHVFWSVIDGHPPSFGSLLHGTRCGSIPLEVSQSWFSTSSRNKLHLLVQLVCSFHRTEVLLNQIIFNEPLLLTTLLYFVRLLFMLFLVLAPSISLHGKRKIKLKTSISRLLFLAHTFLQVSGPLFTLL